MASRMLRSNSQTVSPCEWRPGDAGTSSRSSPFSSWSGHRISTSVRTLVPGQEAAHTNRNILIKQDAQRGDSWRKPKSPRRDRAELRTVPLFPARSGQSRKLSTIALTGSRVPCRTGAPLCTPSLISTSGQPGQSISCLVIGRPNHHNFTFFGHAGRPGFTRQSISSRGAAFAFVPRAIDHTEAAG